MSGGELSERVKGNYVLVGAINTSIYAKRINPPFY